jgi:uncharacterized protein (DUF1330 family)
LARSRFRGFTPRPSPPVYQVVEIDVLDKEAYSKDYIPKAQAAIKAAGGKFLAAGGKTTTIEGGTAEIARCHSTVG